VAVSTELDEIRPRLLGPVLPPSATEACGAKQSPLTLAHQPSPASQLFGQASRPIIHIDSPGEELEKNAARSLAGV
jgi:hypothetical protein